MNWGALITQIAMIALAFNPITAPIATLAPAAILATEDLFKNKPKPLTQADKDAQNAAKLQNALTLVKTGIAATNAIHPGGLNQALTDTLIKDSISAVVDGANVIKSSTLGKLPTPPTA